MANRIYAGGAGNQPDIVEGRANGAAILPGCLLERSVASGVDELALTNNASTTFGNQFLVAREIAQTSGGSIDTPWPDNNTVEAIAVKSGELVYVRVATGNNIATKGAPIASAGNGQFKLAATNGTEQVFAYAEEVINVAANNTLVLVRAV